MFYENVFRCCYWDAGHYPEWDEDHPIHFVGHSAGAQVVRVLQQMLADKVGANGFPCFSHFLLFLEGFLYSFFSLFVVVFVFLII